LGQGGGVGASTCTVLTLISTSEGQKERTADAPVQWASLAASMAERMDIARSALPSSAINWTSNSTVVTSVSSGPPSSANMILEGPDSSL